MCFKAICNENKFSLPQTIKISLHLACKFLLLKWWRTKDRKFLLQRMTNFRERGIIISMRVNKCATLKSHHDNLQFLSHFHEIIQFYKIYCIYTTSHISCNKIFIIIKKRFYSPHFLYIKKKLFFSIAKRKITAHCSVVYLRV